MTLQAQVLAAQQALTTTDVAVGHHATLFVYRNGCRVWQYDWNLN